jgi:transcriptional regulator with XRE-family HTH domain
VKLLVFRRSYSSVPFSVGRRVRALRGFECKQAELAEAIGGAQSHISAIERGLKEPSTSILLKIAHPLREDAFGATAALGSGHRRPNNLASVDGREGVQLGDDLRVRCVRIVEIQVKRNDLTS